MVSQMESYHLHVLLVVLVSPDNLLGILLGATAYVDQNIASQIWQHNNFVFNPSAKQYRLWRNLSRRGRQNINTLHLLIKWLGSKFLEGYLVQWVPDEGCRAKYCDDNDKDEDNSRNVNNVDSGLFINICSSSLMS